MSKEEFKAFVRNRPNLAGFVNRREMTWQEFYDMYELYGPNSSIWDKYITTSSTISLKSFFDVLKNMDMGEVQKSIGSIQKGIGYLRDMVSERQTKEVKKETYEPRKIYEHFDD